MRNNLSELPVLLCCIFAGACAGFAAFLLRLPRRLYEAKRRGLRTPLALGAIFFLLDILTCAAAAALFAAALVYANGGELRAYAAVGYLTSLLINIKLLKALLL